MKTLKKIINALPRVSNLEVMTKKSKLIFIFYVLILFSKRLLFLQFSFIPKKQNNKYNNKTRCI